MNTTQPTMVLHLAGGLEEHLTVSVYKDTHVTGENQPVYVLRAKSGPYSYIWNSDDLADCGDEVFVAGGLKITNVIAARDWALQQVAR